MEKNSGVNSVCAGKGKGGVNTYNAVLVLDLVLALVQSRLSVRDRCGRGSGGSGNDSDEESRELHLGE